MHGRITTPGLYRMLGYPFLFGRDFLLEEGQPGKDHVIILTHKLWERLGSDPRVIGTTIRIDGQPYTVVGVFAPGLTDRGQGEFVVPTGSLRSRAEIKITGRLRSRLGSVTLSQNRFIVKRCHGEPK